MSKKSKLRAAQHPGPTVLEAIVGDSLCSCLFVVGTSLIGEIAELLHERFPSLSKHVGGEWAIGILLVLLFLLSFSPICSVFSGAIFNPVNSFALVLSGKGALPGHVARMVAQLGGALAGTYVATGLIPPEYQGKFRHNAGALREGVSIESGFLCEAALGVMASLLFLYSLDMKNKFLAFWVPLLATAAWCYIGSFLTGPSMNPNLAFSWNWHYQTHTPYEHVVVFWLGPFSGAGLAGLVYLLLTKAGLVGAASAAPKKRKARNGAAKQATQRNAPALVDSGNSAPPVPGRRRSARAPKTESGATTTLTQRRSTRRSNATSN